MKKIILSSFLIFVAFCLFAQRDTTKKITTTINGIGYNASTLHYFFIVYDDIRHRIHYMRKKENSFYSAGIIFSRKRTHTGHAAGNIYEIFPTGLSLEYGRILRKEKKTNLFISSNMNIQSIEVYAGDRIVYISLDNCFGMGMPLFRRSYFTLGMGFSLVYIDEYFGPLLNISLSVTHLFKKQNT